MRRADSICRQAIATTRRKQLARLAEALELMISTPRPAEVRRRPGPHQNASQRGGFTPDSSAVDESRAGPLRTDWRVKVAPAPTYPQANSYPQDADSQAVDKSGMSDMSTYQPCFLTLWRCGFQSAGIVQALAPTFTAPGILPVAARRLTQV